jgi:uncharacterized protein (DUF1778 family)
MKHRARTERINIRVTPNFKAYLDHFCNKHQISITDLIESALLTYTEDKENEIFRDKNISDGNH